MANLPIYYDVRNYGAKMNGTDDDAPALRLAIAAAQAVGGSTVFVPYGPMKLGKDGANPWCIRINAGSNIRILGSGWGTRWIQTADAASGACPLVLIDGASTGTTIEGISISQGGLTNPGAGDCPLIDIAQGEITKILYCKFQDGISGAGPYVRVGGTGNSCSVIWLSGLDMVDAGGPNILIDGLVSVVWIEDGRFEQDDDDDNILILDSISEAIADIKLFGNTITSTQKYAVRASSADTLERLQFDDNTISGFVSVTGAVRSQFQGGTVSASVAGISEPVIMIDNCSEYQLQEVIVRRNATCAQGLVVKIRDSDTSQLQGCQWHQETDDTGLVHVQDCAALQLQGNIGRAADAGSDVADAYLIESTDTLADNIQIADNISADAGEWDNAVRVKATSPSGTVGAIQVHGMIKSCDVGVLFDDDSQGAAVFTQAADGLMVGGLIAATSAAFDIIVSGVPIHIGANASKFGVNHIAGRGDPNGVFVKRRGSYYTRLDGGAGTSFYVKESDTGSSNWGAK